MFEIASTAMPIRNQLRRSVSLCYRAADGESDAGNRHWLILRRAYRTGDRALQPHTDPLFRQRVSIWVTSRTMAAVPGTSAAGLAGVVRPQTCHADRPDGQGKTVRASDMAWDRGS